MSRLSSETLTALAESVQAVLSPRQTAKPWKGSRSDRLYINEEGRQSERCYYEFSGDERIAYRYGNNFYCFPGGVFEPGRCDDYGGSALLESGYRILRGN